MPYYITRTVANTVIVCAEEFGVRSNAHKYATRRGWKQYTVITAEQRKMVEAGDVSFFNPEPEDAQKPKGKGHRAKDK